MSNAGSMGSILGWGARILQATTSTEHFKNKNKETEGRRERNAQRDMRGKWQKIQMVKETEGETQAVHPGNSQEQRTPDIQARPCRE